MTSWTMSMSQRIFNINNIAKNINSLSSPDLISGVYILQDETVVQQQLTQIVFTNCMMVHFFCATLYIMHCVNGIPEDQK